MIRRLDCIALILLVGACCAATATAQENTSSKPSVRLLHDFLGDQCSFVPDLDIGFCCGAHDDAYQLGGNRRDRLEADRDFRTCVLKAGRPVVAQLYYTGVRLFGWLFFNFGGSPSGV